MSGCAGGTSQTATAKQKREMAEVEKLLAEAGMGDVLLPDITHLGPQSIAMELDQDRAVADMLEAAEHGDAAGPGDDLTADNLAQACNSTCTPPPPPPPALTAAGPGMQNALFNAGRRLLDNRDIVILIELTENLFSHAAVGIPATHAR